MRSFIKLDIKTGLLTTFQGDFPELEVSLKKKKIERVSYIVPVSPLKRLAFYILRTIPGDPFARWCRSWNCKWMLKWRNVKIISTDRQELIRIERLLFSLSVKST